MDWAIAKQQQWDVVITDYDRVIAMLEGSPVSATKSTSGTLKEELALALADYSKANQRTTDQIMIQKITRAVEFIEQWRKETGS